MSWSGKYHRFAHVLEAVEQYASTENIDPSRHGGEYRVTLQYEHEGDDWEAVLSRMEAEVETLNEGLSHDNLNVRTYPDMVEVFLAFELGEDGGDE